MISKIYKTIQAYLRLPRMLEEINRRSDKSEKKMVQSVEAIHKILKSLDKKLHASLKNQEILVPFLSLDAERQIENSSLQPVLLEEYQHLLDMRKQNLVVVNQPMVLISQVHRSGGTLLSQLFDGHPELHAHPYELQIGYPDKTHWPRLNLNDSAENWFRYLGEGHILRLFREGFTKPGRGSDHAQPALPFLMMPLLVRSLFLEALARKKVQSARDILNAYMTAYFNGWLDNQNIYGKLQKWITAFVPRLNLDQTNLDLFFQDYPDGRVIQVLREPKSWYASASRHLKHPDHNDIEQQIDLWIRSAKSMQWLRAKYPEKVRIIRFEALLNDTGRIMKELCLFLGIEFNPVLLEPTFNFMPVCANSSFEAAAPGVLPSAADRTAALSPAEKRFIDDRTREVYESILQHLESYV